jgi:uncharacterized protein YdhG (YjbR/CyaY superfamily)
MQSTATTVTDYLAEVPNERHSALETLRALCLEHLVGFEEGMAYGMPCYSRDGVAEVAFASQKNNIALYIMHKDVLDRYRAAFAKSSIGKGCIRYSNAAKIDYTVVTRLLVETCASRGPLCD